MHSRLLTYQANKPPLRLVGHTLHVISYPGAVGKREFVEILRKCVSGGQIVFLS
jgi:hypothetical protein